MSLYSQWQALVEEARNDGTDVKFWERYFESETQAYKQILSGKQLRYSGTVSSLASEFNLSEPMFAGFVDGINTSLNSKVELESFEPETEIELDISLEKLYFNMHVAKADWLYSLPEWEELLSEAERKQIAKEYRDSMRYVRETEKISPNSPCPCGSGAKYKRCCGKPSN